MSQCFLLLRGACFAEEGYYLRVHEVAPEGLRREMSLHFAVLNRDNKTLRVEKVPGFEGDLGQEDMVAHAIPLAPYKDPEFGRQLVLIAASRLRDAAKGSLEARAVVGEAWCLLALSERTSGGLRSERAFDLLCALYGRGRVIDELDRRGTVAALLKGLEPAALLAEALGAKELPTVCA